MSKAGGTTSTRCVRTASLPDDHIATGEDAAHRSGEIAARTGFLSAFRDLRSGKAHDKAGIDRVEFRVQVATLDEHRTA
ncbi:hypothetical protein [Bosea thiooxidans]|uniref:hypothetical protein n=1 Tax=Bosea thiooxidans TaxID=53254 RepID=UPI00158FC00A|nr:hypothetical protein [Bosea thiooxidans]